MKIVTIYHSIDLDGYMSAAIVKHWFNQQEVPNGRRYCSVCEHTLPDDSVGSTACCGGMTITDNNTMDFIGYNYGQPIPDLSEYDKVIMCDVSFPKYDMSIIKSKHQSIFNPGFIYIDHHISAMKDLGIDNENSFAPKYDGIQNTNFAACELTWKYFFPDEPMPEIVRLLGRYDCFGYKGTHEETAVLEFQYGARQCISNYEEAYHNLVYNLNHDIADTLEINYKTSIWENGIAIYQYLCTEAKQAYKNGFSISLPNITI
jgi:oligoribonuclease NrnB/cAMP/cGMP phosphodiesterase (DHH superfamily)